MKQLLLICAVVAVVGCGKATKEKAAKIKAAADARAAAEKKATETATIPQPPQTTSDKLITNPIVKKAVRKSLKKPEGELTEADYEKVTVLSFVASGLTEVPKGIEKLTQLKDLDLWHNQLISVKSLEELTQLRSLALFSNQLTEVKGLEKLVKLTALHLNDNKLTEVKGLENLTQLKGLALGKNKLTDVNGLEKLTQLKALVLTGNPDLTKAQIDELQKALPECKIDHNAKK